MELNTLKPAPGSKRARKVAKKTMRRVREAIFG